jgi:hypothetical protein
MPYSETDNITLTKLALLSERARQDPKLQFTSLAHLLNAGFLKACYDLPYGWWAREPLTEGCLFPRS